MAIESTLEEPLLFFENFFLENGYDEIKMSFFLEWKQAKESNPNDVIINELEENVVHYFASDEKNLSIGTTLLFIDKLKTIFNKEVQKSKRNITSGIRHIVFKGNSPLTYLANQEKSILEILNNRTILLNKYPITQTYLESLQKFIEVNTIKIHVPPIKAENNREDSLNKVEIHPRINLTWPKNKNPFKKPPFFHTTKLNDKFFSSLFQLLFANGIIKIEDSYEIELNKFLYLFKSPTPWENEYSIQFDVDNLEATLIIDELSNLIDNLIPVEIEKCRSFYKKNKKQKKLFKAQDIYEARGTIEKHRTQNSSWVRPEIQHVISEMEKIAKKFRLQKPQSSSQSSSQSPS